MLTKSTLATLLFAALTLCFQVSQASAQDIDRENGVVTITGTNDHDDCDIYIDGNDLVIELAVMNQTGNLLDFTDKDYDLDDVTLIIFDGFDGDDAMVNNSNIPCIAYGGAGNDYLRGGSADDDLFGGPGRDYLSGRFGNDYLKPGTGEDESYCKGGPGRDTFAMPGIIVSYSRQLVPMEVDYAYDFNSYYDTMTLFYVPLYTYAYPSTSFSTLR